MSYATDYSFYGVYGVVLITQPSGFYRMIVGTTHSIKSLELNFLKPEVV